MTLVETSHGAGISAQANHEFAVNGWPLPRRFQVDLGFVPPNLNLVYGSSDERYEALVFSFLNFAVAHFKPLALYMHP